MQGAVLKGQAVPGRKRQLWWAAQPRHNMCPLLSGGASGGERRRWPRGPAHRGGLTIHGGLQLAALAGCDGRTWASWYGCRLGTHACESGARGGRIDARAMRSASCSFRACKASERCSFCRPKYRRRLPSAGAPRGCPGLCRMANFSPKAVHPVVYCHPDMSEHAWHAEVRCGEGMCRAPWRNRFRLWLQPLTG